MPESNHQAAGLARLFAGHPASLTSVSVAASPHGPETSEWVLGLAQALSGLQYRVCVVETRAASLSAALGCRPMRGWQDGRAPGEQIIHVNGIHLLSAPGCMSGSPDIVSAVAGCGSYDFLLFDTGKISLDMGAISPQTRQTLVILMEKQDVQAVYAVHKALHLADSPAQSLIVGEGAGAVSQAARHFLNQNPQICKISDDLCQNNNNSGGTSSDTLTINSNLTWIVSRIQPKNHKRVANGGVGKSSEESGQGRDNPAIPAAG